MKVFKSISKLSALLMQVLLVIGVVLVFSYFDPFELLAPTKKKLKNTPIQVRSIKEIGELITAEYYGEVITSLEEVYTDEAIEAIEDFNTEIEALHIDFISAIDSLARRKLSKKEIYPEFVLGYGDIIDYPLFKQYAYYINEKLNDKKYKKKEVGKELDDNRLSEFIEKLGLERKQNRRNDLHRIAMQEIQSRFKDQTENVVKNKSQHRRLVLLGRGWVKAGFDFGSFTEDNFKYDRDRHRIIFIGLNPQILSATINPWFIPEEGVEGFEFIVVERKVKHNPEQTILVKKRCLEKLVNQAMEKQILSRAQSNAERHLNDFFSLLIDDDEFNGVFFFTDYLEYSLNALLYDSILSNEEVLSVDTMLKSVIKPKDNSYAADRGKTFLDSLRNSNTQIYDIPITLNSKSALLFNIVKDKRIDTNDLIYFRNLKKISRIDTIWAMCLNNSEPESLLKNNLDDFTKDLEKIKSEQDIEVDTIKNSP